jgi:hypothetical protein
MQEERLEDSHPSEQMNLDPTEGRELADQGSNHREEPHDPHEDTERGENSIREDDTSDLYAEKQYRSKSHRSVSETPNVKAELETDKPHRQRKPRSKVDRQSKVERSRNIIQKKNGPDEHNNKYRREYKNYDEMVACVNLLKYMDWDKVDSRVHKNSPCSLI